MINPKIWEFQYKIEKKLKKFKKITFEQFLIAWIGFAGVQALTQFLIVKTPDQWMQEEYVLEFYNDPVFYLGLMLTFLIALFIMRKWDFK